jgi:N-acetylglutamate synthase-like GNAT family acetyltransferase
MTTDVHVRLALPTDAEAISSVLLKAFGAYKDSYSPEAFSIVTPDAAEIATRFDEGPQWVAEIDGQVIGTASITTEPEGLYIRSMAVDPSVQGRGIGHKLLSAVDEYAPTTDQERIFLYTTYFTPGAKEMYEKHGYKWFRETTAEEWYDTPGLEMDKTIERSAKQNAIGS